MTLVWNKKTDKNAQHFFYHLPLKFGKVCFEDLRESKVMTTQQKKFERHFDSCFITFSMETQNNPFCSFTDDFPNMLPNLCIYFFMNYIIKYKKFRSELNSYPIWFTQLFQ